MIGAVLGVLLAVTSAWAIDTPTIPTDTVDTNKIKNDSVDTGKLMNTAHRVQSLGINRAGGLAIGPNALSVNGVADFAGVDASSVTASTVTAHVLSVLGPATLNTQGSSTTVKGILLVDGSTFTVTLAPGGATLFRVNTQDGVRIATNAVVTGSLTVDGSSMTVAGSVALASAGGTNRVGIGLAAGAAGFPLEILGAAGNGIGIRGRTNGDVDDSCITYVENDGTTTQGSMCVATRSITFDSNGGSFAFIDGVTVAGSSLTIRSTGNVPFRIESSNGGGDPSIDLHDGTAIRWQIASAAANDRLYLYSTAERLTILQDGSIGVGTASPGTKLHMSSGTLTVDGTSALIKIGDAAATPTAGQLIASPPAAQTIAAGNTITADACGGVKVVTAAGAVTTSLVDTITAPAAANAGCCMDLVNTSAANTITLDQNANNNLAADTALGPCDTIRACSNGASGRWYFNAVFAGTCN